MVPSFGPLTLGLAVASLAASAGGVWVSIRLARRVGAMDVPNERSSHSVPTPRMGGVPMVAAAVLGFGCWAFLAAGEAFSVKGLPYAVLFALGASLLGLWDDLSPLPPLFRFIVQISGAFLCLWASAGLFRELLAGRWALPPIVWISASAVWIVWMLNLYNFMDGIDGLAGGEAALASAFFFLLFARHGESGWAVANLLIAAAAAGFLVFNWPPAQVFMGDAGSAFLGAFYGMQSVVASLTTPIPFAVLILPFANFILDTTVTLIRRAWRGEKWYTPHRSHFYQRMTGLGMTHRKVTILELCVLAGSCAAAAVYFESDTAGRAVVMCGVLAGLAAGGIWVSQQERSWK